MKLHGIKRTWSRPLFMKRGKHHCPVCSEELEKIKVSKVVNSKSEEAKEYDFSIGDVSMVGNAKFIWTEFFCSKCNKNYSVDEIYRTEKMKKEKRNK